MKELSFPDYNINMPVASAWNELTESQLKKVALLIHSTGYRADIMLKLVYTILFSTQKRFARWIFAHKITSEQVVLTLYPLIDFVFQENTLTKCIIEKMRYRIWPYYGPGDGLKNISLFEFSVADTFFLRYKNENKVEHLDKMIASLYRPRSFVSFIKPVQDKRIRFNSEALNFRMAKGLTLETKLAILTFFEGCRNTIINHYPEVFKSTGKQSDLGYSELLLEMAGDKFGDFEKTGNTSLFTILIYLKMIDQRKK